MFCSQCGKTIDDDSRFCRHCGAAQAVAEPSAEPLTPPSPTVSSRPEEDIPAAEPPKSYAGWIIGGALVLLCAFVGLGSLEQPTGTTQREIDTLDAAADNLEAAAAGLSGANVAEASASPWSYSTDEDKVRGTTDYFATTTSTNTIRQSFPYSDATTMTITVRKSSSSGTDVLLTISSGQMMCPSYKGCSGTVRFDNGSAERIEFNGPADSSSETIFVVGAKSFIAKLKKAKKVVVEKTLYEAGNPQFEFDVAGLEWEH